MEQKNFVGLINFIFRDIGRMRLMLMTKVDDNDVDNDNDSEYGADGYDDKNK